MISDKRTFPTVNAAKKKKSTMNVRTAILYRKGLAALIDESVSSAHPTRAALTPTSPGPRVSSADAAVVSDRLCAGVSSPAADALLSVWVQGGVPVQKVWDVVL